MEVYKMTLERKNLTPNLQAYYRPGTSDERVLEEIFTKAGYRRRSPFPFDVEKGERWLDLGANIGAFALYCLHRGASATCYEPEPECFNILSLNVPTFIRFPFAVTAKRDERINFWTGRLPNDHYRGTAHPTKRLPRHSGLTVQNLYGQVLQDLEYDGVKMDIEGSEGELLDAEFIPKCKKLCMEYHLSRDPSMDHLRRRIDFLRSRFRRVHYPPEFDRIMAQGGEVKTFFDRLIFATNE
jgi:FkbM family methyltransferase